jgi:Asp-tRNA(Asn)/Glu-tRNA(Gln) amidotransferase A subunit family amidase
MKEAGAIVVGRTNMSEAAFASNGFSPIHGITRNPFDLNRNSGGSSAGTGAGIGSGMAPCGLGTDTFGSCRVPAICCGGTGMRPSIGRYNSEGILPCLWDFDTPGPFGVTVADLALLDSVLSGLPKAMPRENLNGVTFGSPSDWFPENIAAENKQALDVAIKAAVNIGGTLNDSAFHKDFDTDYMKTLMLNYTFGPVNDYLAKRAKELNLTCDDLKCTVMAGFHWKDTMKDKTQEEFEEREKKVAEEKAL